MTWGGPGWDEFRSCRQGEGSGGLRVGWGLQQAPQIQGHRDLGYQELVSNCHWYSPKFRC